MTSLGLALLVIGAVVAVAENHYPTHGIAGGTGVLVMALGAVLAITGLGAGVLLALLAGGALAAAGAGGVVLSVRKGGAVRHRRVRTGAEGIIGHLGTVRSWTDASGRVAVDGALWQARRSLGPADDEDEDEDTPELHTGDRVVVEHLNGLTLSVRRAEDWELL
ncbi:MAG TPA: NfeD family protein [Solirubrobacteraceae bacterium]|jgi:membrane-bound serine protease (ClpP class)|nr:NfeD family protein [Solirubrobacteraceae bacterium]